jgi:fatty acid synthase subunit alpha, fungi type
VRAAPEDTPEHAARLAILLRAVSHFTTTLLSEIDIHSLVASYEHEPRKKVPSAFYVARANLVEYDVEGTPKLATPSLLAEALSGRASIFALFGGQGINEIYCSSIHAVHLLNLSSLPSSTRSFSHLPPPPRVPLPRSTA